MQKLIIAALLSIALRGVIVINAQSVIVQTTDGTESLKLLSTVQNFTFSETEMLIAFISGDNEAFNLTNIRKIYFKDAAVSSIENNIIISSQLSVYPNPAKDCIYISNLKNDKVKVNIYGSDGKLIQQNEVSSESEPIDLSNLSGGFYIIMVNNQAVKFIKL